jgi:protein O-GlcNAc transferase
MKIISFCLYGENPRYHIGVEKNAELADKMLPDWLCYVYHNRTLPEIVINKLSKFKNIKLINVNMLDHGMFWRFLPFYESEDNICISRDADSRITNREVLCINEWLNSEKKFHIIKDHAQHFNMPIMGGMWGMKGDLDKTILDNMNEFINASGWHYGKDQEWLIYLWQFAQKDCLIHSMRDASWFRDTRSNMENKFDFIGNGWTEDNKPMYHYEDHGCQLF